jgi:3'(2'), 5'-bisphosphate nucleotidase
MLAWPLPAAPSGRGNPRDPQASLRDNASFPEFPMPDPTRTTTGITLQDPGVPLPSGITTTALLEALRPLCWGAADILRAYARGEQPPYGFPAALQVDEGGEGPVSAADLAVNRWLLDGLHQAFPQAAWTLLSEETAREQLEEGVPLAAEWLWILDPLDGTKDFLQGTGEYAVHLALVHRGTPVLGVVLLPELEELWFGLLGIDAGSPGQAWSEDRAGAASPATLSSRRTVGELVLVASRSHRDARLEQLLEALQLADTIAMGSVGGKVATILRGETDLYISLSGRSAPKDWDMAAPEAVLRAAGGAFSHADGTPLQYNTGDIRQAGCLIASHGLAHAALCDLSAAAMAEIDPGFPL